MIPDDGLFIDSFMIRSLMMMHYLLAVGEDSRLEALHHLGDHRLQGDLKELLLRGEVREDLVEVVDELLLVIGIVLLDDGDLVLVRQRVHHGNDRRLLLAVRPRPDAHYDAHPPVGERKAITWLVMINCMGCV